MSRNPWVFALAYVGLSLGTEIVLMVVFGLKVPQDNALLAPIVLLLPPLFTALLANCPTVGATILVAIIFSVATIIMTMLVTRMTGNSIGFLEPILARTTAGLLAFFITRRLRRCSAA